MPDGSRAGKLKEKALRQYRTGHWSKCLATSRQAVRLLGSDADLLRVMALCLFHLGRKDEARRTLNKVLRAQPENIPALLNLASIERECGQLRKARELLLLARNINPNDPVVHFNLGNTFIADAHYKEARQAFAEAVKIKPAYWQAWLNHGHVSKSLGEIEEAASCYRQVLLHRPANSQAYLGLANLKHSFLRQDDAVELQRLLDSSSSETSRIEAGFALGEYFHANKAWAKAAWCWQQANQQKRKQLSAQGKVWRPSTGPEKLGMTSKSLKEQYKKMLNNGINPESERVVFVTGLPRSGTTLVEQALASHSAVTGASELPFIPRLLTSLAQKKKLANAHELMAEASLHEWQKLGQDYLQQTARWQKTPFFVDKLPENLDFLGEILFMLPRAKVIVCQRTPQALALSNYRQLYATGREWAYSLDTIYQHFLHQQRKLALWLRVFPGRILCVEYEEMVADLPECVSGLNRLLGLNTEEAQWTPHRLKREVRTASAGQVTRPVNTNSVDLWRNYDGLLPLTHCFQDASASLG